MQSYYDELHKKRRASRIFWFLVFGFAIFLYYFFQGYYPSLDISLKQILSGSGMRTIGQDELVRAFGIVNIRVEPRDARIQINREDIGYDEKKMVPYDVYSLSIGKPGYIQNRLSFAIDKSTPYYIDTVRLIPRATYEQLSSGSLTLIKLSETDWMSIGDGVSAVSPHTFSGTTRIGTWGPHVGEGYFLSGTSLARYEKGIWQKKSWSGSLGLIRECSASIVIKEGHMWCPNTGNLITEVGLSYTGIIEIGRGYIRDEDTLFTDSKSLTLTDAETGATLWIESGGKWYIPSGGNFIPLQGETSQKPLPLIITPLDSISYAAWQDGVLIIFGKKGADTFVTFLREGEVPRLIPFPDIALQEVRIVNYEGNTFFKTKYALLFLYHNSETIEWLIDGEILGFSDIAALYKKGDAVWRAYWGEE